MQRNQLCARILILLTICSNTTFGMSEPLKPITTDKEWNELCLQTSREEKEATAIFDAAIQKNDLGKIYFHIPCYEKYLNKNSNIPWQAIFRANRMMIDKIDAITSQHDQSRYKNAKESKVLLEKFKAKQRAIIYCESARELLKRSNNDDRANIVSLQRFSIYEYGKAYKNEAVKLRNALHIAFHRWNICSCNELYSAPLARSTNSFSYDQK